MNINIFLIQKIENIIKLSDEFDNIFYNLIKLSEQPKQEITSTNIDNLYRLTQLFIFIRSEHGALLILMDRKKNKINNEPSDLTDELINELYDISTFSSIIQNIYELIANIDFEFKRIAILFPKYINKRPITIILFVDKIDIENIYIQFIEQAKITNPENKYIVIESNLNQKINCTKILGKKLNIYIEKLPSLFIVNEHHITELLIDKITDAQTFIKLLD